MSNVKAQISKEMQMAKKFLRFGHLSLFRHLPACRKEVLKLGIKESVSMWGNYRKGGLSRDEESDPYRSSP